MGGGRRKREECGPLKSGKRRDDIKEEEEERDVCQKMRPSFCDFLRGKGKRVARASPLDGCIVDFLRFSFSFSIFGFCGGCCGGGMFSLLFSRRQKCLLKKVFIFF